MKIAMVAAVCVLGLLAAAAAWLWTPDRPRAALEARYLRSPADLITVAGTQLHVRVDGPPTAPAVIMVHGFGSSLETWEPWARSLSDEFRVIRLDLPGSGLSPPDATGLYTDARTITLITALMDRLGVTRATLVGNSIGGRIAFTLAARHPERVERLVLISPDGFASPGFDYGKAPKSSGVMGLMRYALPKAMVRMNLAPSYGDPARLTPAVVDRYYDLLLAPGARGALLDRMSQTILEDPRPLLARISAPVLLMWGRKDQLIPFANAADYQAVLPHSRLVEFPDLGHVPQEEDPQGSLPPLRSFLRQPLSGAKSMSSGPDAGQG